MNILVIDDEVEIVSLFQQRFLKEIKGGEIQFTFAHSGQKAYITCMSNLLNNCLFCEIISVRDDGIGLSVSIKSKIFQPFFTTKPTEKRQD